MKVEVSIPLAELELLKSDLEKCEQSLAMAQLKLRQAKTTIDFYVKKLRIKRDQLEAGNRNSNETIIIPGSEFRMKPFKN